MNQEQAVLRSNGSKVFLAKIWGPILCVWSAVSVFGRDFPSWKSLMIIPFFIAAFFGLSMAVIEVRGGVLRYRRLRKWKTINRDEIVAARMEWGPIFASVRLKRFLFPWGRLYFVLDGPSVPFQKEYRLLNYVNATLPVVDDGSRAPLSEASERRNTARAGMAALAGVVVYFLTALLQGWLKSLMHASVMAGPSTQPFPVALLARFEFRLACFIVFACLAWFRRRQPDAWISAFLAGMGLPYVLLRWL